MGKFDFKNLKISNSKPKKKKNTPCKDKRFHDIREMLDCVCRENSTKPAFYTKINGKFRPITFSHLRSDIRSLGAALMHRGLAGKKNTSFGRQLLPLGAIISYCALRSRSHNPRKQGSSHRRSLQYSKGFGRGSYNIFTQM